MFIPNTFEINYETILYGKDLKISNINNINTVFNCSNNTVFNGNDECHDKLINRELATELIVLCYSDSLINGDKSCS